MAQEYKTAWIPQNAEFAGRMRMLQAAPGHRDPRRSMAVRLRTSGAKKSRVSGGRHRDRPL